MNLVGPLRPRVSYKGEQEIESVSFSVSIVSYELKESFDVVVSNLCVSILFREVQTQVICSIEITETIGVFIRIRGTTNEIVNHNLNEWLCKWGSLEVSNNNSLRRGRGNQQPV
jgi:hypothetical protein